MKKRILFDATPLLYTRKGIGRSVLMTLKHLTPINDDFEIVLFGRRLQGRSLRGFANGLRTIHLRLPRAFERVIKLGRMIELLAAADLYHATDFYMPLHNYEKAVANIYDTIFLKNLEKIVDHVRLSRWVPEFARRCRRIITISEFSKKEIVSDLQVDPEKVEVIYLGVDRELFSPMEDQAFVKRQLSQLYGFQRSYFLAVSCYTGRKNTPLLLESYVELLKNNPENDLVLVWDAPEEILQTYAMGKNAGRIHFLGSQSDNALRILYCGATALVFPSTYEGFGMPVIEAMSCGTPVITSNCTSLPEVAGPAGLYIDPYDKTIIVTALEAFENDSLNRQELCAKCLTQAKQFTWERCALQTLGVYRKCLQG